MVGQQKYFPILKSRQGELKALRELAEPVGDDLRPIVELVDIDVEGQNAAQVQQTLQRAVDKIATAWPAGRPPIIVDTTGTEPDPEGVTDMHGDPAPPDPTTPAIFERLRYAGVQAIPVARVSDPETFINGPLAEAVQIAEQGVCVRISAEDLDDAFTPLEQAVIQLVEALALRPELVDVVLDFGSVADENTAAMATRLGRFVLPTLDRYPWRSFVLAAGAFPVNLSDVAAYVTGEVPRRDRALWMNLAQMSLRRELDYGDYAVTHPVLQTGVAFAAPPQLRYTVDDSWLILKGRRTDRLGHRQFYELCNRLREERPTAIAPPIRSWGDDYFHKAANSAGDASAEVGPGNAATWRAIGTSHHIAFVLGGLRRRGEP